MLEDILQSKDQTKPLYGNLKLVMYKYKRDH